MKTNWELSLLYSSIDDPQIDVDLVQIEKDVLEFESKYREATGYLKDSDALRGALSDYEELEDKIGSWKPMIFFYYLKYLDSANPDYDAKINKILEHLTKLNNKILFFELKLGQVEKEVQKKFLADPKLVHFHYYLQRGFKTAKYDLSEAEEKIMSLKSNPAKYMWVKAVEKKLDTLEVEVEGKEVPLSEATNKISELDTKERREVANQVYAKLKSASDFVEAEMNAILTDKKINDELRGFSKPYSATILGYENEEEEVLELVDAVTKRFDISHKFYDVKAKLLKLDELQYCDRSAKIGEISKEYTFEETVETFRRVLSNLGGKYVDILDGYLEKGQIDVYPKKGKSSGAFCSGVINLPTFVLLNHTNSFRDALVFAHEMGHAVHTEFAREQTPLYQDYSFSTAETASTLFEDLMFEEMVKDLIDEEKVIAMQNRLNDEVSTVFRQIAFFNYEVDLHEKLRETGFVSKEEMAKMMNEHMSSYLGPKFNLSEDSGYYFTFISHFRRYFYVYAYAYGKLVSKVLFEKLREDSSYISQVEKFLSAGGSDTPHNIFKSIGIDTTDIGLWEYGLNGIGEDILKLELLTIR